jgi:hypothetical protein
VAVSWSGIDAGSGVAAYDVQACVAATVTPDCWVDWQVGTAGTAAPFTGTHGLVAAFRSRAYDAAGNREDYPAEPDARTVVDGRGPRTWFRASPGIEPYLVQWSGEDAPAGLAYYDLYFRDESAEAWEPWLLGVTTTQALFSGKAGRTVHLCVRGVDRAGNVEDKACPAGLGAWPPAGEAVLAFPPTSRVEALPPIAPGRTFTVRWAGPPGGLYDVQAADLESGDGWVDWLVGTPLTAADYTGAAGHTYAFRCRVRRADGTAEPWPWGHDAYTIVPESEGAGAAPRSSGTLARAGRPGGGEARAARQQL